MHRYMIFIEYLETDKIKFFNTIIEFTWTIHKLNILTLL